MSLNLIPQLLFEANRLSEIVVFVELSTRSAALFIETVVRSRVKPVEDMTETAPLLEEISLSETVTSDDSVTPRPEPLLRWS